MRLRRLFHFVIAAGLSALAGCSDYEHRERPPWRAQAEQACLAQGSVHESSAIRAFHEMDGPGICGVTHPYKVTALADGSVVLNATQTLDCPMIAALDRWVREVVQPAAQARFGEPVVKIESMGSYSCRGINNMSGASLSEHAFANAIDIGGFVLASGRELNIMRGFNGADDQVKAFLHEAHAGACTYFTTILGPGHNIFHYNHFHMDLAMHGMTSRGPRRYCKPVPQTNLPEPPAKDNLPDPPPIDEEMDIARAPIPAPELRGGAPVLMASAPPAIPAHAAAYSPRLATSSGSVRPSPLGEPLANPAPPSRDEAPLITFAEAPDPRPIPTAPVPATHVSPSRPILRPNSAAEPAGEDLQAAGVAHTGPGTARRSPSPDGTASPQDWDLTSSISR